MSGFLINPYRFAAAGDPYFSNVSLLLHGDGTNGSTTITDSSGSPKTVSVFGNAQISTAQSKFGGASILLDGTGDRLTTPSNSAFAFGTADFTVEAWIMESARAQYATLIEIGNHLTTGVIFLTNGGNNQNGNIGGYAESMGGFVSYQTAGSLNVWNHVAYVRASGTLTAYANGVAGTSQSLNFNHTDTSTVTIGSRAGGSSSYDFNGYIDDLRITKGVARYTANFTPPTAPFPTS
jgi:hypothetical protein